MYVEAFLLNVLMGRIFAKGTAFVDFRANNPGICGKFLTCLKISSLGNLVENFAFGSWNIFSRSNHAYIITITTKELFIVF